MAALDWIVVLVMAASLVLGAWRGLVFELLSLLGWVAAFLLAQWLAPDVGRLLPMTTANETLRYGVGFIVVFVGGIFGFGLVAALAQRLVRAAGLRPADRALGAAFGIVRGGLLLLVLTAGLQVLQMTSAPWWEESVAATWLVQALHTVQSWLPDRLAQFLPP